MDLRTGKSIWDDMPDEWNPNTDNSDKTEETDLSSECPTQELPIIDLKKFPMDDKKDSSNEPVIKETPKEETKDSPSKPIKETPVTEIKESPSESKQTKRKQKKQEKEKISEFVKKDKDNKQNSSEHVTEAYKIEQKGNKRDFIILGIAIAVIVVGIVIFVVSTTKTSTQHVYSLIEERNYGSAYQEINDLYEANKNVDSLVYDFAEDCANNSEYKRAIASLEFLSSDAQSNKEFFDTLVNIMLSHGKTNRANEVLEYMQSHGLEEYANELYNKYKDSF